jgi:hypothetical protein
LAQVPRSYLEDNLGYNAVEAVQRRVEFRDASLPGYELGSRGTELIWQLQSNGKKGIRQRKEDFMCDLKLP